MLDQAVNDRYTLVGAGTPAGELYRRHWLPVATEAEAIEREVIRVRVLGEDLVLFRADGSYGLVAERCPHRGASLGYGFPDEGSLRCPYHGWKFDKTGSCIEQPNQTPDSPRLRERSAIAAYPVKVLGGLVFAYMGTGEPPALPHLDVFARTEEKGSFRDIGSAVIPCNWLQIMENSFDPTHVEWLHGRYFNYHLERAGEEPTVLGGHHVKLGFDLVDYGIIKRRLREGQTEEDEDWKVGHPVVFPHILKVGGQGFSSLQIRVPIDDTTTKHFWYCWYDLPEEYNALVDECQGLSESYDVSLQDESGRFLMDTIDSQDAMVWVTQGARTTRDDEHLSSSDQGIALYRNLLRAQLEACEAGGELMNVKDASTEGEVIDLPQEQKDLGMGGASRNPLSTFLRTQARYSNRVQFLNERIDAVDGSGVDGGPAASS